MVIGCECGKGKITSKEYDKEYGMYYIYFECEECEYYWEGYVD